ncbi:MAG: divalent-cation tolerance protein CutA [Euryarchaeota archaeon]|nr:divalent-cation tolerance protein CutA [Euryarchaeota archaeon]MBV1728923.1 divalent-cation tolerance protein CutA [Methanobacterium sp.]MBU4548062.1 divalent-cation tolerance protein CutA [Euryarchaeota archaeon]MBU4608243.1 divalent-cation tolerance protein CutA [Euryarchaeota archaeon]MBV1755240.1 divalent-cation tolerance protein CutA [Methanobacterium sp.]
MFAMVYITTSSKEESTRIGKKLVQDRLAGCVNIQGDVKSFYYWEGNIEEDAESVLLVKTKTSKVEKIIKRVKELHSYENPCIVALPIINGSPEYLNWLKDEMERDSD